MTDYSTAQPERRPRPFRNAMILAGVAFLGGIGLAGWAVTSWEPAKDLVAPVADPAPSLPPSAARPLALAPQDQTPLPATEQAMQARIAAMEARIYSLSGAGVSGGTSRRAEGLLLAFAARRAIDRGLALGYLEPELSDYFGPTQPKAVAQVIAASRAPATLAQLKTELDRIAPGLSEPDADEGFFASVQRELAGLFIVRQAGTPPAAAKDRVARAQAELDIGRVDRALAEIARLRGRDKAQVWMGMARRNIEAANALDLLEASALMAPPRDAPVPEPVVGPPDPERVPDPVSPAPNTPSALLPGGPA